jgi:formylglycine-generating enzyme required for sulfatase activity
MMAKLTLNHWELNMQCNLKDKDINLLSDREAMGLPVHYTDSLNVNLSLLEKYFVFPVSELVEICESKKHSLEERLSAAKVLGIKGDCRISTLNPQMITVPGTSKFEVGISKEKAIDVYEQYKSVGVQLDWILKESPSFIANIEEFSLGKYLVTNIEYKEFLDDTNYKVLPSSWKFGKYPEFKPNCPVYSVSVEDAKNYAAWLSKKTGLKYRLPTEIEWEYAACSDENREFPWGDKFNCEYANTIELGILEDTPVGIFPSGQSKYGHFDMAGNVEEFVDTIYYPYSEDNQVEDDLLKKLSNYYIARGGSFTRFADLARGKRRHGHYPSELYLMGLRLCLSK